jgi:GT2 family glycosyltransferase
LGDVCSDSLEGKSNIEVPSSGMLANEAKPYQICSSIVLFENDPAEVTAAIRSVLDAPMRTACTVIDNSPTCSLRQCVLNAGAQYIHSAENVGFGAAHNIALRTHIGVSEFSLIQNPDVEFSADTLSALYEFMLNRPEVGLVMPGILYPDGTEQRLCKRLPGPIDLILRRFSGPIGRVLFRGQLKRYELAHLDMGIPREVPCLSGCFMFIRSAVLREIGCFDERYFMYMEDVDLCRRIGVNYKTVFYPNVSVTHGYRKGSYRTSKLMKYHIQSAIRYFGKWGWLWDPVRKDLNHRTGPLVS